MTRCIHCTRCVRFGTEVAGMRELGTVWRGEHMEIKTFVGKSLASEVSGNIIDLCPVGALTSKPYRYTARAWELQQRQTIAPHDCLGSNLNVHVRRNEVMRIVPRANEAINETWLADRDRFSYAGLNSEDRVTQPMIKQAGRWQAVSWEDALEFVIEGIQKAIAVEGPEQLAGIISPSATLEESYLLQKLLRGLGCANIDHRLRQTDFADQDSMPLYPGLAVKIAELEQQKAICIIGCNIRQEQPLLALRIRKASLKGAQVFSVNPLDYQTNFTVQQKLICHPQRLPEMLAGVIKALAAKQLNALSDVLVKQLELVEVTEQQQAIADGLQINQPASILLGAIAQQHPQAATIRTLANLLAELTGATVSLLTEGANTAGAWLAGAVPHRGVVGLVQEKIGEPIAQLFAKPRKAYILFNIEPEQDCANPKQVTQALQHADFVVTFTAYNTTYLQQHADVMLPIAQFTETSGSYVNAEGEWQSFTAVTSAPGEVKPGWKILRVLANLFELPGFEYVVSTEIRDELKAMLANHVFTAAKQAQPILNLTHNNHSYTRITEWPMYRVDSLVRRSTPLQQAASHESVGIRVNSQTATQLQLTEGFMATVEQAGEQAILPVIIDERVPESCALIAGGFSETGVLGESFGAITIHA
jgi:NADH-quinone oxidoreductase subunit G